MTRRCAGTTTAVAAREEFVKGFPLQHYEDHISRSPARHSSVMHRCRVDRELSALFCGIQQHDDSGVMLMYRVDANELERGTSHHTV